MGGMSMREILFRAKRIDNGEWVKGYFWRGVDHIYMIPSHVGIGYDDKTKNMSAYAVEVEPETICQYTGLTDKNGNRIWENDIVEDKRFNEFYKIVFRVRDGGWYVENIKSGALFRIMERTSYQYERCGNIFDNPELLKGGLACEN